MEQLITRVNRWKRTHWWEVKIDALMEEDCFLGFQGFQLTTNVILAPYSDFPVHKNDPSVKRNSPSERQRWTLCTFTWWTWKQLGPLFGNWSTRTALSMRSWRPGQECQETGDFTQAPGVSRSWASSQHWVVASDIFWSVYKLIIKLVSNLIQLVRLLVFL